MTTYYVTADRGYLSTGQNDTVFVKEGVAISGAIDMRGSGSGGLSGQQSIFLQGGVFGYVNDYWTSTSGGNQVHIGKTGYIYNDWWGAIQMGGGGNTIVNEGSIVSTVYGNAIYILGSSGAYQDEATTIINSGVISGASRTSSQPVLNITSLAEVYITNSGEILSGNSNYAITASGISGSQIINTGLIRGNISFSGGDLYFNSRFGELIGSVSSGNGADYLGGSAGEDILMGNAGADTLLGRGGDDTLNGGSGADYMAGLDGDDIYVVDNVDDVVMELNDRGIDLVRSLIDHTLSGNVEDLTLVEGFAGIVGTGNVLDNTITGNSSHNRLSGLAGDDTLVGGDGNDTLDGGIGADRMSGGVGNDTYRVDNPGDVVIEKGGEGTDLVQSAISYTLTSSVEALGLTGSASISGTGNSGANTLTGNSGSNALSGLTGNDTISAGSGNDTLTGGAGADLMTGGTGADRFVYTSTADSTVATSGRDLITDFSHAQGDRIDLSAIDANTSSSGDQAFSATLVASFTGVSGQLRTFVSGGDTYVQGDVNGDGTADFSIRIDLALTLVASDFVL